MNQRFNAAIQYLEKFFGEVIEVNQRSDHEVDIGNYWVAFNPFERKWVVFDMGKDESKFFLESTDDPVSAICHALALAAPDALEEMMLGVGD